MLFSGRAKLKQKRQKNKLKYLNIPVFNQYEKIYILISGF